ncbi:hypothetical protein EDD11_007796 [Mortierella claussenii]|nr:hypothetical protein EDD11_007796 [Mortierella claussenii]
MTTPRRSSSKYTLLRQQESSDRAKVLSLLSISSEKPRFHSTIPTPRVLRSMNDRSRRYGCDIETRKSKRLSSPDRSSNSRCIAAVLRALFSTDLVARDLGEPYWLRVSGPRQSLYRSLVETFAPYSKNEYAEVKEDIVSENVIKSSKGRLGDEDDAREFLNDTLNQVRQEFRERSTNKTCPLSRLFECNIDHTLVCLDCGNRIVQTEHYQDFCLELPACDSNRSSQRAVSIGGLFPQVFDTQHISFQCEACHSESAMVHRSISKLPEVLVVYLKRFTSRPNNGYNKNRSRVAIDDSLEFLRYSEDEGEHGYPSIPSDSPPSSSSQCFSSISPVERDDSFSSFSTPLAPGTIAHDYIDADLYNSLAHGNSAANPHLLNSDDDNDDDTDQLYDNSRSFSVYDAPSEDEQYHWAMEESIRASQSLSQESTLSGGNIQPSESEMGALLPDGLKTPTVMLDSDNALDAKFLLTKKLEEKSSVSWDSSSRKGNGSGKDDGTSDEEDVDEQIKAAIRASLLSVELQNEAAPLTEQELQEQENKQLEEAIRRSLLDTEENKENISPEKGRSGKKKKGYVTKAKDRDKETITGAHPRGLTRSCSQSQMATSASFRTTTCSAASAAFTTARPRLLRAHTVDVLAKFEMSSSQEKEEQVGQVSMSRRTRSSCSMDILNKDNNRQKGKDKAPSKVQTATREHTKGLFQLQAMVSHTGLVSSSSEGHYVCDSRGADGIWRSYDGGKRTRIGSIAELSQYRGRSGYLFFYVHQSLAA